MDDDPRKQPVELCNECPFSTGMGDSECMPAFARCTLTGAALEHDRQWNFHPPKSCPLREGPQTIEVHLVEEEPKPKPRPADPNRRIRWAKIGNEWGIRVNPDFTAAERAEMSDFVTVVSQDGRETPAPLGRRVKSDRYGGVYEVDRQYGQDYDEDHGFGASFW